MMLLGGLGALFGGGAAAAGATAGAAAGAVGSSFSLAGLLQGTATVLGIMTAIGAGNAEAEQLEMQANDAEAEKPLETLQGIARRTSIKKAMADAIGEQNTAYAGSGLDLSFGTASEARKDAFRESDLALTTATGTEETRQARLTERATNYRSMAKRPRRMGLLNGLMGGVKGFAGMFD